MWDTLNNMILLLSSKIIHNVSDSVVCISCSQHESLTIRDTTARLLWRHVHVLQCGVARGVAEWLVGLRAMKDKKHLHGPL